MEETKEFMDNEGYPTEFLIKTIEKFNGLDPKDIWNFWTHIILPCWIYYDLDWMKETKNYWKLELHTGSWSGNEEIMRAILSNGYLTKWACSYRKWKTGGHHYFRMKKFDTDEEV
jgi:hypothetical protein